MHIWTDRTRRSRLISDFLSAAPEGRRPLNNIYRLMDKKVIIKSPISNLVMQFVRLTHKGFGVILL